MRLFVDRFDSPLGPLNIAVNAEGRVLYLWFAAGEGVRRVDMMLRRSTVVKEPSACRTVSDQLNEYFAGCRQTFELDLQTEGTRFQKAVWKTLLQVPWGRTISYRELAERIGNPHAARAVGGAVGANPLPILVPCHRVLAAMGRIGGYSGGLDKKRLLLEIEGISWKE